MRINILIVFSLGVFLFILIDSYGIYLDELKDQVEKLKTKEDFPETVELVDKFDEDKLRHLHFTRIQQKNRECLTKWQMQW